MDADIRDLPFPIHVVRASALDGYRLSLDFEIGRDKRPMAGIFDMSGYLDWPVFAPLRDPAAFTKVFSDGLTACWPGEIDIAPERLYTDCVPI